ncbi:MAG: patatin-like phospholipase family protein, partial [Alphaproteobacteria bacterium]|nr:patatin-like phospholipase family protein [Alphaproteobacteria bacterium]
IPLESFGDMFSVIAGTSTGGIITLGMRARSQMKVEKMKPGMQGLVDLYETQGETIFTPKAKGLFTKVFSPLTSNKYLATPLEGILETYFGDLTLKDLHAPTLVTTYDLGNEILYLFNSSEAKNNPSHDYKLKYAARATSAAPTYFPAVKVLSEAGEERIFIDGGVTANNPTLLAYLEAQKLHPKDRFYVVSLGCGMMPLFTPQNREGGGLLQWAGDIFPVVSNSSNFMTENLMSTSTQLRKDGYMRIQFDLAEKVKEMDSTDKQNIQYLKGYAKRAIDNKNHKIHQIKTFLLEQIQANNWSVYLNLASSIDQQIKEDKESLDLKNSHLTDRAFWEVKQKLLATDHRLRNLCLQGNALTPFMIQCLGELPMMMQLDLRETHLTQVLFKDLKNTFGQLKNLTTIDLRNNQALKEGDPTSLLNLISKDDKYDAYTVSFDEEVWHKLGKYMHEAKNFDGAVYFYKKGTTALTQLALAELYLMTQQGDEKNQKEYYKQGINLCKTLAEKGEQKAQFLMGNFFERTQTHSMIKQYLTEDNLISLQEDLNQKAAYYYKLAADKHHKRAAFLLAELYFSNKVMPVFYGEGRSQKALHQLQEALRYYEIAANAGSHAAKKKIPNVEKAIQELKEKK